MASASARTISRLVTKPLAFRPFLHGRDGLPVWSGSPRWSTTQTTQDKPAESEPVKSSSNETDNTTHHPSRSLSPKKVYRFNIPDRVWKAPIATKENPLKYNINRTIPFSTLPVYSIMKPGLGQIWTVIKRIDGDLQTLKEDLILDFPDSQPIIKPNIKHILCRGQIVKEVKLWLQDRGF